MLQQPQENSTPHYNDMEIQGYGETCLTSQQTQALYELFLDCTDQGNLFRGLAVFLGLTITPKWQAHSEREVKPVTAAEAATCPPHSHSPFFLSKGCLHGLTLQCAQLKNHISTLLYRYRWPIRFKQKLLENVSGKVLKKLIQLGFKCLYPFPFLLSEVCKAEVVNRAPAFIS